tara:strand:- start:1506 stop:2351 length:846 start_codon:yes stop_codon:yes gene_type:complete
LIERIDHLIVAVKDLEAAEDNYKKIFGHDPVWRGAHESLGTKNSIFNFNNLYFELLAANGKGAGASLVNSSIEENGEGLAGLVFGSDNIETTKQQLSSKGYELSGLALGEGFDEDAGKKRTWESLFLPNEITRGLFSFAIEHKTGKLDLLDRFTSDCVHKLDHVVINTNDAEGFIRVYEKDLGIRLALDQTVEKWGGRMLFFRLNQTTIEVIARPDEGLSKDSLWGLAWDVEDLEATHTRLTKLGIEASDVKEGRKPNTLVSTIKSNTCNIPTLFIQHLDS